MATQRRTNPKAAKQAVLSEEQRKRPIPARAQGATVVNLQLLHQKDKDPRSFSEWLERQILLRIVLPRWEEIHPGEEPPTVH